MRMQVLTPCMSYRFQSTQIYKLVTTPVKKPTIITQRIKMKTYRFFCSFPVFWITCEIAQCNERPEEILLVCQVMHDPFVRRSAFSPYSCTSVINIFQGFICIDIDTVGKQWCILSAPPVYDLSQGHCQQIP